MNELCEIQVKGRLHNEWTDWLDGLTIANNDRDETMLSGPIRDQSALYGIIAKIRDMGLCLISVKWMAGASTPESSQESGVSPKEGSDVRLERCNDETGTA